MTDYSHWQSSLVELSGLSYPPVGRTQEIKLTPNEIVNFYAPIEELAESGRRRLKLLEIQQVKARKK